MGVCMCVCLHHIFRWLLTYICKFIHKYLYVYVYVYIYIYIYIYLYIYIHIQIHTYIYVYTYTYTTIHIYMHIHTYMCICESTCIHIYYTYICIYIYIFIIHVNITGCPEKCNDPRRLIYGADSHTHELCGFGAQATRQKLFFPYPENPVARRMCVSECPGLLTDDLRVARALGLVEHFRGAASCIYMYIFTYMHACIYIYRYIDVYI